jgi:hypothetical protein
MTLTQFFGRRPVTPDGAAQPLDLRAGEWVEVRPLEEVMATLDASGALEALPFMPEMARYCGQRFQVFKAAHKTCDTIRTFTGRRLERTVHLAGLRCDGGGHGGCQAACLLFWKEAWLRRVDGPRAAGEAQLGTTARRGLARLRRWARADRPLDAEERYRCQATELLRATTPLDVFDPRLYLRDVTSGNLSAWTLLWGLLRALARIVRNRLRRLGGAAYPPAAAVPPSGPLDLRAGELVQIRPKAEILATLENGTSNRGLSFDPEMAPYCGGTYRVLRRVERIIDEGSGRMLRLRKDCIMLEGVVCSGLHCGLVRLGCPRSVYPYWREAWLRRVAPATAAPALAQPATAETVES